MNEETEILICKAGSGELTSSEETRWRELCQADPQLEALAEDFRRMSDRFTEQINRALSGPDPDVVVPARVLERLEQARRDVFEPAPIKSRPIQRGAKSSSFWQTLREQVRSLLDSSGPMLVATALIALLAVGWVLWKQSDRTGPIIATIKSAGVDPDLPMASPGPVTFLLDPPAIWVSVDPTPVVVTVWSIDGEQELFHAEAARPPLHLAQMKPSAKENATLQTGQSYLFRFERGDVQSERTVTVSQEARTIETWTSSGASEGRALAESWLAEGRPGDALALAGALAARYPEEAESFSDLRSRSLKAALKKVDFLQ